ncbi:MAG: hypothetical protein O3B64_00620 [bacterium]|nr:hypothetical protein [bacterium]
MLKILHREEAMVDEERLQSEANRILPYVGELSLIAKATGYDAPEASLQLPYDESIRTQVKGLAKELGKHIEVIVVIGIGGSNLGTMAMYQALRGVQDSLTRNWPKLLFLDTLSGQNLEDISSYLINLQDTTSFAVISISKSGGTAETMANTQALYNKLQIAYGDVSDRFIVVTGDGSKLWNRAKELNMYRLTIPEKVGGRYSIFSAVGLLPLALSGADIDAMHRGAREVIEICTINDIEKNPALYSAIVTYLHAQDGKNIHNSFFFDPRMELTGKWYRQLMGESIGKQYSVFGEELRAGVTPIVSTGSTDLHSMAQLYFGGPRDKITNIVYGPFNDVRLQGDEFSGLVQDLPGKTFNDVMSAILGGTMEAYTKNKMPFLAIELEDYTEASLSGYLQFRMCEMMCLAQLFDVNAFDQPNVEDYKSETRRLLRNIE